MGRLGDDLGKLFCTYQGCAHGIYCKTDAVGGSNATLEEKMSGRRERFMMSPTRHKSEKISQLTLEQSMCCSHSSPCGVLILGNEGTRCFCCGIEENYFFFLCLRGH